MMMIMTTYDDRWCQMMMMIVNRDLWRKAPKTQDRGRGTLSFPWPLPIYNYDNDDDDMLADEDDDDDNIDGI